MCTQTKPSADSQSHDGLLSAPDNVVLFQLMVESVKDYAIFALDTEGYVATWNSGAAALKGYGADEIIGKHFSVFYPPEDVAEGKPERELQTALREGKFEEEGWRIRKDGSRLWANVVMTPMRDAEGHLQGYAKVTRDMTERRQAHEALQNAYDDLETKTAEHMAALEASEMQLHLVLDAVPAGIVYLDQEHRYRFSNRLYTARLGLLPEDIVGKHGLEILGEEYYTRIKPYVDLALTGQAVSYEREVVSPDLRTHYFQADYVPDIDSNGVVHGFAALLYDITERKQAQMALLRMNDELEARVTERTAELLRSNADLQQFAYVASHDLQEPLRMVASFMQLLEKKYSGQLDAQADRWIEYAVDGANRMQTLISDLLTYSRVGTHGCAFHICEIKKALSIALHNLHIAILESNAEIACDVLPSLPGDEIQLVSLFQNLISNAIKYRGEQAPRIHISAQREGPEWLFAVRDNGIGIDAQFSERIFIIFQRLHNRKKYPGTGIGLALCKRILERHGGRIWVESEPDQGTVFYFTLPTEQKESSHTSAESM